MLIATILAKGVVKVVVITIVNTIVNTLIVEDVVFALPNVMEVAMGLVRQHVNILENVINAQIFAKVVVREVAMVRVNPLQKEKIH